MKRTYVFLATLLLAFLLSVPTFAQEATQVVEPVPTVETVATEVPAPVSVPIVQPSDMITWAYIVIAAIGVIGFTYILQLAVRMLGNSVPQSAIEGIMNRVVDATLAEAKRMADVSQNKIDDGIVNALIARQKANALPQPTVSAQPPVIYNAPTLPAPDAPVIDFSHPPVGNTGTSTMDLSTPPFNPAIPTADFMDTFGKRGDNSYTWNSAGHPAAVIEIPDGYNYHLDPFDANKNQYPYKAVNTNAEYGTRLNVAFTAGRYTFVRTKHVQLGIGRHEIALSYVADVKDTEGGQPMHNWLWTEAKIDGQPVIAGTGTVNHRALQNGAHTATWVFDNLTPRTVSLSFEVVVHWASAQGNSTIDLKSFGLTQAG
jgi:hypothetical protein